MRINVADLKKTPGAQLEISLEEPLPSLAEEGVQEVRLLAPVRVDLRLRNVDGVILAEGKIRAQVSLCCSRCLKEFSQNLEVAVNEAYSDAGDFPGKGEEEEDGIIFFSGNYIDLTAAVRENLLAALPMKVTCREDCRGLCPRCGQDLNLGDCGCRRQEIDPRLASLGKLLARE
ncbi:MAG TPA: DUF177 domain-containing protein [Firmicutes bacterium]|nr:DUF177 domain-containing protein [Bacillota bacterium]